MRGVRVTIGWTRSDMENGYSSFSDGYRRGASQHVETVSVEVPEDWDVPRIAEAVFEATNSPAVEPGDGSVPGAILAAILREGYRGKQAHFSLSVGDTVTVADTMVEVKRFGVEVVNA